MSIGLVLRLTDTSTNTSTTHHFARFPVRIGRNQLNELTLPYSFVSQFHCIVELHNGELMLRDLGSRNGTLLPNGHAKAYEAMPLSPFHNCFAISSCVFNCWLDHVDARAVPRRKQLAINPLASTVFPVHMGETTALSSDVIAEALARSRTSASAAQAGPVASHSLPPELVHLSALYHQYRNAWAQLRNALTEALRSANAEQRNRLFTWVRSSLGGIDNEPEFQQLAASHAAAGMVESGALRRAEAAALSGLQTLAALYLPKGKPPSTDVEVVQFLSKIRDTLDVFFNAFIPMRDGQRQFASQLNLQRRASRSEIAEMAASYGVESAKDSAELAYWLLNWRDEYSSGHQALEGAFADLMIHQIAMLNGIMRGVKALLHELSPSSIEGAFGRSGSTGSGWKFGPFRYRALWNLFRTRHADVDDGEHRIFKLLFGVDFAQVYSQMMDEATTDTGTPPQRNS